MDLWQARSMMDRACRSTVPWGMWMVCRFVKLRRIRVLLFWSSSTMPNWIGGPLTPVLISLPLGWLHEADHTSDPHRSLGQKRSKYRHANQEGRKASMTHCSHHNHTGVRSRRYREGRRDSHVRGVGCTGACI